MNRDINSKDYKLEGGQSRKTVAWLGTLEAAIVEYIYRNGLIRFQPVFLAKELKVDVRRIHDALKRLKAKGAITKIARGLYQIVQDKFTKLIEYPVRRIQSTVNRSVKEKHDTSPPWDVGGSGGLVGYVEPVVRSAGARRVGGGLLFSGRVVSSRSGMGAGGVGGKLVGGGGDPLFFDHVVGYRGMDFTFGERGRLRWRDLVFYERVVSVEVGAYLDIPFWDGVLKVYHPAGEPKPVVEWQHPKNFLKEHGLLDVRRVFWERLVDAIIGFSRLVLDGAPWWVVKRLVRELRALGVCRGVVYV